MDYQNPSFPSWFPYNSYQQQYQNAYSPGGPMGYYPSLGGYGGAYGGGYGGGGGGYGGGYGGGAQIPGGYTGGPGGLASWLQQTSPGGRTGDEAWFGQQPGGGVSSNTNANGGQVMQANGTPAGWSGSADQWQQHLNQLNQQQANPNQSMWGQSNGQFSTQNLTPQDSLYLNYMKNLAPGAGAGMEKFMVQDLFHGDPTQIKNALNNLNATDPASVQQFDPSTYNGQFKDAFNNFFQQNPNAVQNMTNAGYANPLTGQYSTGGLPGVFQNYFNNNADAMKNFQQYGAGMRPRTGLLGS